MAVNTDKAYKNITEKFRWGGIAEALKDGKKLYLDETVRRMVTTTRSTMLDLATALVNEAIEADDLDSLTTDKARIEAFKKDRYKKAIEIVDLMNEKLPASVSPYTVQIPQKAAEIYARVGLATGNKEIQAKSLRMLEDEMNRVEGYVRYYQSLKPWQYGTLTRTDKYISQVYMIELLTAYQDAGGDPEKKINEFAARGIDFNRMQVQ